MSDKHPKEEGVAAAAPASLNVPRASGGHNHFQGQQQQPHGKYPYSGQPYQGRKPQGQRPQGANKFVNQNGKKPYNKHGNQNHHYQQGQAIPQQAPGANYYGFPMYSYPYYPAAGAGYPMMPNAPQYGMPMQSSPTHTHLAPIPPAQVPALASNPTTPVLSPPQIATQMVSPKIKLTTKDGKPVDLEGMRKEQAAHHTATTPKSSPAPIKANLAPQKPPVAAAPEPVAAPVAAPVQKAATPEAKPASDSSAKSAAMEEFKRKILERAAAAKAAKEPKTEAPKTEAPKPVEKEVEPKAEPKVEPAQPQEEPKAEPKEEPKPEVTKEETKEETKAEEPKVEEAKVEEPKAEAVVEEPKAVEPKAEEAKAEEEPKVEQTIPDETKVEEPKAEEPKAEEPNAEEEAKELQNVEPLAEPVADAEEPSAEPKDAGESAEPKEPSEPKEVKIEEPTEEIPEEKAEEEDESFTVTQFLAKVNEAEMIEDIYSVTYPEGFTGADPSKKLEGKKFRYDPQFLYQFKDVVQFRVDPEFKAILDNASVEVRPRQNRQNSKFGMGMRRDNQLFRLGSQFNEPRQNLRSGSKRRGQGSSRDKGSRRNQSKRGKEKEEDNPQITIPKEEIKPLANSASRWVPRSRQKTEEQLVAEDGTVLLSPEDVDRKTKSLLNKLTLEMFDPITDDILKIAAQSKHEKDSKTVRSVIQHTFAKACDEPYWSEMYAKFCAKMCTNISDEVSDETMVLKDGTVPSGGALARRLLLTTCQTEYEKGWVDKLPTNDDGLPLEPEMMSDEYYAMAAAKRRGLGLVKFIGHLYNLNMLNDQVIFFCLRDQCKNCVDPSEDSLENLVQLVKTVGPKLEADESTRPILQLVFKNIQKILDNVELSLRIKFMLMDLQDLRKAKWVLMRAGDAGPKTIEEIHRDAELKKLEEKQQLDNKKRRHHDSGRLNSSRAGSLWNNSSQSSFLKKLPLFSRSNSQAPAAPAASPAPEMTRESSKRSESTHVNRFAALDDDDDSE